MAGNIPILQKKPAAAFKQAAKAELHRHGLLGLKSQVVAVFDISGSMEFPESRFYSTGIMSGLASRVLGLGLQLDDNGSVPVYALNHMVAKMSEELTVANLDGYIDRHFRRIEGGTAYAPTIRQIVQDAGAGDPMLVLIFTDGDNANEDHGPAQQAIRDASKYPIFWQFFGIYGRGRQPAFSFLHKLDELSGRVVDNAGFSPLGLYEITDEQLYEMLLHEYKDYPEKAKRAGLLPWDPSNVASSGQRRGGLGSLFGRR